MSWITHLIVFISQTKQVQNHPHGHPYCTVDRPQIRGGIWRQGNNKKAFDIWISLHSGLLLWHSGRDHKRLLCKKRRSNGRNNSRDWHPGESQLSFIKVVVSQVFLRLPFCLRWQRSRTGLGTKEQVPHCGSRERNTALPSYRKPGKTTK